MRFFGSNSLVTDFSRVSLRTMTEQWQGYRWTACFRREAGFRAPVHAITRGIHVQQSIVQRFPEAFLPHAVKFVESSAGLWTVLSDVHKAWITLIRVIMQRIRCRQI